MNKNLREYLENRGYTEEELNRMFSLPAETEPCECQTFEDTVTPEDFSGDYNEEFVPESLEEVIEAVEVFAEEIESESSLSKTEEVQADEPKITVFDPDLLGYTVTKCEYTVFCNRTYKVEQRAYTDGSQVVAVELATPPNRLYKRYSSERKHYNESRANILLNKVVSDFVHGTLDVSQSVGYDLMV